MTNFDKIHEYFLQFESPEIFIDWDYLYAISSCLGRKVWLQEGLPIFPNEYVIIVAPPAVGKSLPARRLGEIISSLQVSKRKPNGDEVVEDLVNVVPDCITLERLYEVLEKSGTAIRLPDKDKVPYFHTSVSFLLADEMGLLLKKSERTKDIILFLNAGYDCTSKFKYETKRNGINLVTNLCISFFGCCTPTWMAENIAASYVDEGWSSRVIFVWGEEKRKLTPFYTFDASHEQILKELRTHFKQIATLVGEVTFTPEAKEYLRHRYNSTNGYKEQRPNNDPKLDSYFSRRHLHFQKCCMLMHFAEYTSMTISLDTVKKADAFLGKTELNMNKALNSVSSNPTAKLAEEIMRAIGSSENGLTRPEIVVKFFARALGGMQSIDEALSYLTVTQQVNFVSGAKYNLAKKVINFDKQDKIKTTGQSNVSAG